MENEGLLVALQDGILQYIISEKVKETYCHKKPDPKDITYAEIRFEKDEVIIDKIKCGSCYCEPYLKE